MAVTPLVAAVSRLWQVMADDYGLLADLPYDATMARARRGELLAATPRLVELTVSGGLAVADAAEAVAELGRFDWTDHRHRRTAVEGALDAWWAEALALDRGEHREPFTPPVVLGVVLGWGSPLVRWLEPWLAALDGPGARHLAEVVVGGPDCLSGPAWAGKADQAGQVLGWARTETVVNGLTLIGATHLDDGLLSDALDRLIG